MYLELAAVGLCAGVLCLGVYRPAPQLQRCTKTDLLQNKAAWSLKLKNTSWRPMSCHVSFATATQACADLSGAFKDEVLLLQTGTVVLGPDTPEVVLSVTTHDVCSWRNVLVWEHEVVRAVRRKHLLVNVSYCWLPGLVANKTYQI